MRLTAAVLVSVLGAVAGTAAMAQGADAKGPRPRVAAVPDHDPLIAAIDTNGDGRMSYEEWHAKGMPDSSWKMLNKDGYITKAIMLANGPPDGIDLNGDGVLTLAEFLEFDRRGPGGAPGAGTAGPAAANRPSLPAGERALAMLLVQNTFSKHAYYHQVGLYCEELRDVWVSENGPHGRTATWTSSAGVEEGITLIKKNYCTLHAEGLKQKLAEISRKIPSIRNAPENIGVGGEYVMHTQETPVIEVAGDGKTAKGIWYSIGLAVRGSVTDDGKASLATGWMWEKYAADFALEDGQWKLWHLVNVMDQGPAEPGAAQGPPPPRSDADARMERKGSGREVTRPNPDDYAWGPTVVPKIYPRIPEPYYTFSETFSY
jgi:hypothetical protein